MLWPIVQTAGRMLNLALASREIRFDLLQDAKIAYRDTGSRHVACRSDEVAVGLEFAEIGPAHGYDCKWLDRRSALELSPALNPDTVLGALWSATELTVDPREVLTTLPKFLTEQHNVHFEWGCPVLAIEGNEPQTSRGSWTSPNIIVCSGSDFETLYPKCFASSGVPAVSCNAAHYTARQWVAIGIVASWWAYVPLLSFVPDMSTLPTLQRRIADQIPDYEKYGITQYGLSPSIFNRDEIDQLFSNTSKPLRRFRTLTCPSAGSAFTRNISTNRMFVSNRRTKHRAVSDEKRSCRK